MGRDYAQVFLAVPIDRARINEVVVGYVPSARINGVSESILTVRLPIGGGFGKCDFIQQQRTGDIGACRYVLDLGLTDLYSLGHCRGMSV